MSRNKVLYGNYSRYLNRKVHATDHCCPDSKVVCEGKRGPQGPIGITGPPGPQPDAGQTYEITLGTPYDMSYNSLVFHPFTNANFPTNSTDTIAGYPITRASTIVSGRLFLTKDLSGATASDSYNRHYILFKTDVSGGRERIQFPTDVSNAFVASTFFTNTSSPTNLLTSDYATINHKVTPTTRYYKSYDLTGIKPNTILDAGDFVFAGKLKNTASGWISSGPMLTLVLKVN